MAVTSQGAKSLGLTAALVAGGLSTADRLVHGKAPGAFVLFGAAGAAVVLTALAGPFPTTVAAFAAVVIVTSIATHGYTAATTVVHNLTT